MNKEKESFEPKVMFETGKEEPDSCVCPKCGNESAKRMGVPCQSMKCPICGSILVGK